MGYGCRQTKAAPKRKKTGKEKDDEDADEEEEETTALAQKSTSKPAKKKESASKAAKGGPENSSKTANKNPAGGDGEEDAHENLKNKYYMHKYKERDLDKGGKGDLEGLVPYTVAQILKLETKKCKNAQGMNCFYCMLLLSSAVELVTFLLHPHTHYLRWQRHVVSLELKHINGDIASTSVCIC